MFGANMWEKVDTKKVRSKLRASHPWEKVGEIANGEQSKRAQTPVTKTSAPTGKRNGLIVIHIKTKKQKIAAPRWDTGTITCSRGHNRATNEKMDIGR